MLKGGWGASGFHDCRDEFREVLALTW